MHRVTLVRQVYLLRVLFLIPNVVFPGLRMVLLGHFKVDFFVPAVVERLHLLVRHVVETLLGLAGGVVVILLPDNVSFVRLTLREMGEGLLNEVIVLGFVNVIKVMLL